MALSSEYVDYDIYLEPDFNPVKFANSLVLATNSPTDLDIDLNAPAKRLGYDLDEVEVLIERISNASYTELLASITQVESAQAALVPVKEALDSVNSSYSKLSRDIIKPYERSQKIHTALRRLHLTSSLLRILTWYLYLARQMNSLLQTNQPESLFQAVQIIKELQTLVEKSPALKSLHIVRSHDKVLTDQISRVKNQCLLKIRDYTLAQDRSEFSYACRALYILSPETFSRSIASYLKAQINASSTQLTRSLSASILEFEGSANDARSRARAINTLSAILSSARTDTSAVRSDISSEKPESSTLLSYISSSLDLQSLVSSYWRDVASAIDSKLREMTIRNPAITRQLQANAKRLKEIVRTSVVNGGGVSVNGLEVKVMMNCFSILSKS